MWISERKHKKGQWKLWMYMDNQDVADPFKGSRCSRWGRELREVLESFCIAAC